MSRFSDAITSGRYLRLSTVKRNGDVVATPVWMTVDGDDLTVITQATSGKVKRLRNDPGVRVAASDWRGTAKSDEEAGSATIEESPEALEAAIARAKRKYGFEYTLFDLVAKVRRDTTPKLVLRITAAPEAGREAGA